MNSEIIRSLKHNWIVNLLDGSFFGFALGVASFVTVIPLFVSTMTNSAVLIGLIPAIHVVGWQFPQLLVGRRMQRLKHFKPMLMLMTTLERLPFLGLAVVAWFPSLGNEVGLLLTFILLVVQGMSGGLAASPWQSMIGKIIPAEQRGTFFGAQSAVANLLSSLGAILAGLILAKITPTHNFSICFFLACLAMVVSWIFLFQTHEPAKNPEQPQSQPMDYWASLPVILRRDRNFLGFLTSRILSQIAVMAFSFYTVYAVKYMGVSEFESGLMTGVFLATQIVINPLMGWMSDRWSRRSTMAIGVFAAIASALLASVSPSPEWFYLVFILAGIANVATWTIGLAMVLEFGCESERPAYIGLANTLVAPATILAPFLGGWLADGFGYPSAFLASAVAGLVTIFVLQFWVRDPIPVG